MYSGVNIYCISLIRCNILTKRWTRVNDSLCHYGSMYFESIHMVLFNLTTQTDILQYEEGGEVEINMICVFLEYTRLSPHRGCLHHGPLSTYARTDSAGCHQPCLVPAVTTPHMLMDLWVNSQSLFLWGKPGSNCRIKNPGMVWGMGKR